MAGIVITGPAGSGKTRHAESLARFYGKTQIIDMGSEEQMHREGIPDPLPDDALVLTQEQVEGAINIHRALAEAGIS